MSARILHLGRYRSLVAGGASKASARSGATEPRPLSRCVTSAEIADVVRALPDDALLRLLARRLAGGGLDQAPRRRSSPPRRQALERAPRRPRELDGGDPVDDVGAEDDPAELDGGDPVDDVGAEDDPAELDGGDEEPPSGPRRRPLPHRRPRRPKGEVPLDPTLTREQRRSRRKREVRARTISVKRLTKRELWIGAMLNPPSINAAHPRPRTRSACRELPRPCPFVSCVHHLYLDVSPRTGAIKLNFPDLQVAEMTAAARRSRTSARS